MICTAPGHFTVLRFFLYQKLSLFGPDNREARHVIHETPLLANHRIGDPDIHPNQRKTGGQYPTLLLRRRNRGPRGEGGFISSGCDIILENISVAPSFEMEGKALVERKRCTDVGERDNSTLKIGIISCHRLGLQAC